MNTNSPRGLTRAEQMEVCECAFFWIAELKEAVRDLWIDDFDRVLDDLGARLKTMRERLENVEASKAREESDELRREYERGLL